MGQQGANRAQSTVVGFVLIFGILVLALASFQTSVIPDANGQIEYQSYLDSSDDLTQIQTDVSRAASGSRVATNVELGTTYPPRVFFINPPPPAGQLETTTRRNLTLSNVSAVNSETADFWNGTEQNYSFTSLRFTPGYNEINSEPVVANGILTSRDATARSIPLTAQAAIQGTRISLPITQGSVSESGLGVTVISDPVSQSQHTVSVTADQTSGDNITLTIPTQIDAATWEDDILANQLVSNGGNVIGVSPTNSPAVRVELAARDASGELITYQLQLSLIEFRSQSSIASVDTTPAYLTTAARTQRTILTEDTAVLRTAVRDAFNNPVAGTDVTYTLNTTANGDLAGDTDGDGQVTVSSDNDGAASVEYSPSSSGNVEITAENDLDQNGTIDADEQITYTVVVNNAGGDQSSSGSGDVTNGGVSVWGPTNDTEVLAAPNGRWESIAETGSINISKGEYGYNHGSPGQSFELRFSISNSTDTYGVEIIINGGGTQTVKLSQDGTGNSATRSLQNSARDELVDGDTESVNILDSQNASIYQSTDPDSTFGTLAANIRNVGSTSDPAVLRTGLGRARAVVRFDAAISRYTSGNGGGGIAQNVEIVQSQINNGDIVLQFRNNNNQQVTFAEARLDSYSEANTPNNPNEAAIDRVRYQPNTVNQVLVQGEPQQPVNNPTISNNGNQDVTLTPQREQTKSGKIKNTNAETGDELTLTIEFNDGSVRQYVVTL